MNAKKRVFFIAGEVSGDLHGANLIRAWNKQSNNLSLRGGVEIEWKRKEWHF